jgi:hypothetical protein
MPSDPSPENLEAQRQDAEAHALEQAEPVTPLTGTRPSFRDLRRQLSDSELAQSGVQKLLIEDFERAEKECLALPIYIEKYHERDKEVTRLTAKLNVNIALEVSTGIGIAGGSAIISLAPYFWKPDTTKGVIALCLGLFFLLGSSFVKYLQVKQ